MSSYYAEAIAIKLKDLTRQQLDTLVALDDHYPTIVASEDVIGLLTGVFDFWWSQDEDWKYITYEEMLKIIKDKNANRLR